MKKVVAVLICFVILISCMSVSVCAEENHKFYSVSITSSEKVYSEKALICDGDIYIPAESFSKYTRYEYDAEGHCFTIKGQSREKAFKFILVDPSKKRICVSMSGLSFYDLSDYFVVDNIEYLPFCQMLPFLNAEIYDVENGTIYVANNKLSIAEVLYDFDIADYKFNMANEFLDSGLLASAFILPSYLLDTVVNVRFGRLDIITHSGEYNDYKDIFSEFIAEDNLYLKAKAEEPESVELLLDVFNQAGESSKDLHSVYEWIEDAGKTNISSDTGGVLLDSLKEYYDSGELKTDDIKGINDAWTKGKVSLADCIETSVYIYNFFNLIEDNRDMLDAVYEVGDPPKVKNAEKRAAIHIYDLYGDNVIPAITQEIISKYSQDVLNEYLNPFAVYTSAAKVAGFVLKEVMPYSYGDVSKLSLYSNVVNTASSKYGSYMISSKGEAEKIRLSLLLCLMASKKCYEIMEETSDGYNMDKSYYEDKVEKIDQMIIALYAVAENKKFDSLSNVQDIKDKNIEKVKVIIDNPNPYEKAALSNEGLYISDVEYITMDDANYIQLNKDGTVTMQINLLEAIIQVTGTYSGDDEGIIVFSEMVDSVGDIVFSEGAELHNYVDGLKIIYGVEDRFDYKWWRTPPAYLDGQFFRSPDTKRSGSKQNMTTENQVEDTWKILYKERIDKFISQNNKDDIMFSLVLIDENSIPELVMGGSSHLDTATLCWIYDETLYEEQVGYMTSEGFTYIKQSGLIDIRSQWQGSGGDTIYELKEDSLTEIASGTFNNVNYNCTWNGTSVPPMDYDYMLNDVFSRAHAKDVVETTYSYSDVFSAIDSY